MFNLFARYTSVGVINTLIHWIVFALCIYGIQSNQAVANFAGFVVAVSFSFFANARFTFKASTTTKRYMLYVGFMGMLSATVGLAADTCSLPPPSVWCAVSSIQSSIIWGGLPPPFYLYGN